MLVSSTLATLLDAAGARPALDVENLAAIATANHAADPRTTVYRGIKRVLPCETIVFGADGTRSTFDLPTMPPRRSGDVAGHAEALRENLSSVLADTLAPFSSVAVGTGGGLDSSGIYALTARHASRSATLRFTALTLDFAGPGDDRPHMAALLAFAGGSALRVQPREVGAIPHHFFVQDAAPFVWPTSPAETYAARVAKARGAEALLTGLGGDHVLDGDLSCFATRVRRGDLRALIDLARLEVPWRSSARDRLTTYALKPLARGWVPAPLRALWRGRDQADTTPWAGSLLKSTLASLRERPMAPEEDWQTAYALSLSLMLLADGRTQEESATGLPRIDPYLDPRFVDLVASLPPEALFHGGRMRGLFRLAMKGVLPESLRLRTDKASFEPMIHATFAGAAGLPGLRELLTMEATADLGLVEPAAYRDALDRVVRGEPTRRGWMGVWPILAIEGFLRAVRPRSEA